MKGNPRVLVVDDIEANRQAVRAILSPLGIETVQASSGDEALGVLHQGQEAQENGEGEDGPADALEGDELGAALAGALAPGDAGA